MANARANFAAVALSNGNVLVIGGRGEPSPISPILGSAELYNPTTAQWSSGGTMISTRLGHTATVLANGKVLVTGGGIDDLGPNLLITSILASAEIYDPVTNTWSPAASMSEPRYQHTATLLADGKVLVAGGFTSVSSETPLASAEIYDPDADTWSPAGSMNAARVGHAAALLSNGKVLVVSGSADVGSAEIYDPSSNSWTVTGSMNDPRGSFAAVTLTDGTVLVAGGGDAGTVLSSAEIFNPSTGTWTPTLSLVTSRADLTLTLLTDGSVLAAGGAGSVPGFLSSCERFER
jgi:N-acetylneuraminic acid mutarotase